QLLGDGMFVGQPFATFFGFPESAGVRAAVALGSEGAMPMLLELWEFHGIEPVRGPERPVGMRRITFDVDDAVGLGKRLADAGARLVEPGLLVDPAGVEIELRQRG